jgi:ketosteroid isomerase-like protein
VNRIILLTACAANLYLNSLVGQASPTALSRQVFAAESSFAATMARRDLEAFATFLSPEAVFFADTAPLRGKAAVIEGWRQFFAGRDAPFSWKPEVIEVLSSGTLALSSGPVHDPSGKPVGTFNSIWRREPDGRWRVIFDKGSPICSGKRNP